MLNRGVRLKQKLWNEAGQKVLREFPLEGWAGRRRQDLLQLLSELNPQIAKLDQAVERAAQQHPRACLLMTQPGSGRSQLWPS
jgi:transposase